MTTQVPPDLLQTPYRKNIIINGAMQVNQRVYGGPTAITDQAFTYGADRFVCYTDRSTGAATLTRDTDVPTVAESGTVFSASLDVDITTILASPSGTNEGLFLYRIEGYDIAPHIGKNITFSTWVKSNKTGIYSVNMRSTTGSSTYISEIEINTADTWEKKTVTVPLSESTASWNLTNGYGLQVAIFFMVSSAYKTSEINQWRDASSDGGSASTNQVNLFDNTSNYFKTTGWQLEVGDVPTDFEIRNFGEELALCQRYYVRMTNFSTTGFCGNTANSSASIGVQLPVPLCDTPSIVWAETDWRGGGNVATLSTSSTSIQHANGFLRFSRARTGNTLAANTVYMSVSNNTFEADAEL
jgi:hypothetical protein